MFIYEKKLQYPVKIKNTNPKLASVIISQYGGPDGELGASLRYLSQRYSMPYAELKGLLTDIGTEELGHLEMIGAIVHQLTRDLTEDQIRTAGFDTYFVDRTAGVYPTAASGFPYSAASMAVKGDLIADLTEDLAAEQKARVTYDNILRLSDDPDVNDVIKFLRAREIVHFQRFGEGLRLAKDKMNEKNLYSVNPSFHKGLSGGEDARPGGGGRALFAGTQSSFFIRSSTRGMSRAWSSFRSAKSSRVSPCSSMRRPMAIYRDMEDFKLKMSPSGLFRYTSPPHWLTASRNCCTSASERSRMGNTSFLYQTPSLPGWCLTKIPRGAAGVYGRSP